jgi:hypothetical protein
MDATTAVLLASSFATVGWFYTARRTRRLSTKQHTVNVILQTSFSKEFREISERLSPIIKQGKVEKFDANGEKDFRWLANHLEFIAAGVRNGDLDEELVRDCFRTQVVVFFDRCSSYIYTLRNSHRRWETKPPKWWQKLIEYIINRPFQSTRVNPHH